MREAISSSDFTDPTTRRVKQPSISIISQRYWRAAARFSKPGKLNYAIPDEPTTVHDMLLQKSDGAFQLIVWSEKDKGTNNVTVNLGKTYVPVKVYDPTVGTTPVQTLASINSLMLTFSDHPVIISLPK